MGQIRDTAKYHQVSNMYNVDEFGLGYRRGPHCKYLSGLEQRDTVRGTEFVKLKECLTIVLHATQMDWMHYYHPTSVQPVIFTFPK